MPLSVETPAPPKNTMRRLSSIHCCNSSYIVVGTPLLFCFLCHLQSIPFGFRLWGDDKGAEIFQTRKGTKEIIRQFQHFAEFIQQLRGFSPTAGAAQATP